MAKDLIARAATDIDAPKEAVWDALVNPDTIEKYMFGTHVVSDWQVGSTIRWSGEWKGKAYEDRGEVLAVEPGRRLQYTHFSPLSGQPDEPASYHTVTIELSPNGERTHVALAQDNNADEPARAESEKNWTMMLAGLKKLLET